MTGAFVDWLVTGRSRAALLRIGAFVVLIPLAVTSYIYKESLESERRLLHLETDRQADLAASHIQDYINLRLQSLQLLASFHANSQEVTEQEYHNFCSSLMRQIPGFKAINWLDTDFVIRRVAPLEGNERVLNLQIRNTGSFDSAQRSMQTLTPTSSSLFRLVQGEDGFVIFVPVLKNGVLAGLIQGVIPIRSGFNGCLSKSFLNEWNVQVNNAAGQSIFTSPQNVAAPSPTVDCSQKSFMVVDQSWQIQLWPMQQAMARYDLGIPLRVLTVGLVATVLVSLTMLGLIQRQQQLWQALEESCRLQGEISATQQDLRSVLENVDLLAITLDRNARVTFCNNQFVQALHLTREMVEGQPVEYLMDPKHATLFREQFASWVARGTCPPRSEMEYLVSDGSRLLIAWSNVLTLNHAGDIHSFCALGEAVADRTKRDEYLLQAQKLESLGVLAGGIAHDFNNLLTAIMGNTELGLSLLPQDSKAVSYLKKVTTTARRLSDLTRQLLAYSGKGRFVVQNIDLNQQIREMTDLISVSIPKHATVQYELHPQLPQIRADAVQIQQALLNLILNGAEALDKKPGTVTVQTSVQIIGSGQVIPDIIGGPLAPGQYVCLQVNDTGCGMSNQTLKRIFDPYFSTKFAGRGLGLAALQGIVRGHQGAIRIQTALDKGTEFSIYLPASSRTASRKMDAYQISTDTIQGSGLILVVDDEPSVQAVSSATLEASGYRVLTAKDGLEGVERFEMYRHEINTVLLDMTMPRMSGREAFIAMKKINPQIPIVLTSGYSEQEVMEHFHGFELSGILQKPFTPSALLQAIADAQKISPLKSA